MCIVVVDQRPMGVRFWYLQWMDERRRLWNGIRGLLFLTNFIYKKPWHDSKLNKSDYGNNTIVTYKKGMKSAITKRSRRSRIRRRLF